MNSTLRFLLVLAVVLASVPVLSSWVGDGEGEPQVTESMASVGH